MVLSVVREVAQASKSGAKAKRAMSWWLGSWRTPEGKGLRKGTGYGTWDANGKGNVAVFASI
jgi:hypothetical protein